MIRLAWTLIGRFVSGRTSRAIAVAIVSLLAGVAEAAVLILVVRAGLTTVGGDDQVNIPLIGSLHTPTLLAVAGATAIVGLLARLVVERSIARMSADMLEGARIATIRGFSRASWSRQSADREGSLQEIVSNLAAQSSQVVLFYIHGLSSMLGLVSVLLGALFSDPVVVMVVVVVAAALFLSLRPLTTITRRRAVRSVQANSTFNERVAEASGLAMELRVVGVDRQECERLSRDARETANLVFRTRIASRVASTLYRQLAIVLLVGGVAVLYTLGDGRLAAVGTVLALMVRALSYAQQTQTALQQVNELAPNLIELARRIDGLDAAREEFGSTPISEIGEITLSGVSYAYDKAVPAVRDLTLTIRASEVLGVVGPSGGGKSTLVQLLLRLRHPTAGEILVNGIPYAEFDADDWAKITGLVPQEPRFFQGSVAENITFHRPGLTREQIETAARRAYIADDILRMPDGFDSVLGPRGSGLSGGQRQRLAIARALVGSPRLLVLDEPTSALDVHSERLLQRTLEELHGTITMVIIAHRLSTIDACDRVLVLDEGRRVALGTHAEVDGHAFLGRDNATRNSGM